MGASFKLLKKQRIWGGARRRDHGEGRDPAAWGRRQGWRAAEGRGLPGAGDLNPRSQWGDGLPSKNPTAPTFGRVTPPTPFSSDLTGHSLKRLERQNVVGGWYHPRLETYEPLFGPRCGHGRLKGVIGIGKYRERRKRGISLNGESSKVKTTADSGRCALYSRAAPEAVNCNSTGASRDQGAIALPSLTFAAMDSQAVGRLKRNALIARRAGPKGK